MCAEGCRSGKCLLDNPTQPQLVPNKKSSIYLQKEASGVGAVAQWYYACLASEFFPSTTKKKKKEKEARMCFHKDSLSFHLFESVTMLLSFKEQLIHVYKVFPNPQLPTVAACSPFLLIGEVFTYFLC